MKRNSIICLSLLALTFSCNDPKGGVENNTLSEATQDTAVMYKDEQGRIEADGAQIKDVGEDFWAAVDWDAPVVEDPENVDVETRANNDVTIYTMDDRLLFDTDKAQIRPEGEEKLKRIVEKIKNLPPNSQIRIFGHADAREGFEYNMKLSAERANAVKDWMQTNTGINANRLSIEAMGETAPRATNATAWGRQLNRRVAIVVATNQPG